MLFTWWRFFGSAVFRVGNFCAFARQHEQTHDVAPIRKRRLRLVALCHNMPMLTA